MLSIIGFLNFKFRKPCSSVSKKLFRHAADCRIFRQSSETVDQGGIFSEPSAHHFAALGRVGGRPCVFQSCPVPLGQIFRPFFGLLPLHGDPLVIVAVGGFHHVRIVPCVLIAVRPHHQRPDAHAIRIRDAPQRPIDDGAGLCAGDSVIRAEGPVIKALDQFQLRCRLNIPGIPGIAVHIRESAVVPSL